MRPRRLPPLKRSEAEALAAFAAVNGRRWKRHLWDVWMTGNWHRATLGDADPAILQRIRNERGPTWLMRFRLPPPEAR